MLVHQNAGIWTTKKTTHHAHLQIVCKVECSEIKKRHAIGCDYRQVDVDGCWLALTSTTGEYRELHDRFIAAHIRTPLRSSKTFVHTFWTMDHPDVVSSGICPTYFCAKHLRDWMKQAFSLVKDAIDLYMVAIIAKFDIQKQQLIACWFSICLWLFQGKEVGYSWNSLTCILPWIRPKWPTEGFGLPRHRKLTVYSKSLAVTLMKRRCTDCNYPLKCEG